MSNENKGFDRKFQYDRQIEKDEKEKGGFAGFLFKFCALFTVALLIGHAVNFTFYFNNQETALYVSYSARDYKGNAYVGAVLIDNNQKYPETVKEVQALTGRVQGIIHKKGIALESCAVLSWHEVEVDTETKTIIKTNRVK
jgi:hypothetical protein